MNTKVTMRMIKSGWFVIVDGEIEAWFQAEQEAEYDVDMRVAEVGHDNVKYVKADTMIID